MVIMRPAGLCQQKILMTPLWVELTKLPACGAMPKTTQNRTHYTLLIMTSNEHLQPFYQRSMHSIIFQDWNFTNPVCQYSCNLLQIRNEVLLPFCGLLFGFLLPLTADTAKHNLEREAIPNPTNHFHHSSTTILVIKTWNLKKIPA